MADGVIAAACPGHRYVGRAELREHALRFSRRSIRTHTGVADACPAPGASVWGALYEIDEAELAALDAKEGEGWAYERVDVDVALDGRDPPVPAVMYRVRRPEPEEIVPAPEYIAGLIHAARARGLPNAYIAELERHRRRLVMSART
jgi:gamma-glutamylcyclotransferase